MSNKKWFYIYFKQLVPYELGILDDDFAKESKDYLDSTRSIILGEAPADGLQLHDHVEHLVFGKGIIAEIDAHNRTYEVKFDELAVMKLISLDFKRLVKIEI